MDKKEEKQRKILVNVSSLKTAVAAASIAAIMLMMPSYFGATTTGQGMNAYGQIIPPSQLQQQ